MKETDNLADKRIILKLIFKEIGQNDVDWITLAHNTGTWRAAVTTVMKILGPINCGRGEFVD